MEKIIRLGGDYATRGIPYPMQPKDQNGAAARPEESYDALIDAIDGANAKKLGQVLERGDVNIEACSDLIAMRYYAAMKLRTQNRDQEAIENLKVIGALLLACGMEFRPQIVEEMDIGNLYIPSIDALDFKSKLAKNLIDLKQRNAVIMYRDVEPLQPKDRDGKPFANEQSMKDLLNAIENSQVAKLCEVLQRGDIDVAANTDRIVPKLNRTVRASAWKKESKEKADAIAAILITCGLSYEAPQQLFNNVQYSPDVANLKYLPKLGATLDLKARNSAILKREYHFMQDARENGGLHADNPDGLYPDDVIPGVTNLKEPLKIGGTIVSAEPDPKSIKR